MRFPQLVALTDDSGRVIGKRINIVVNVVVASIFGLFIIGTLLLWAFGAAHILTFFNVLGLASSVAAWTLFLTLHVIKALKERAVHGCTWYFKRQAIVVVASMIFWVVFMLIFFGVFYSSDTAPQLNCFGNGTVLPNWEVQVQLASTYAGTAFMVATGFSGVLSFGLACCFNKDADFDLGQAANPNELRQSAASCQIAEEVVTLNPQATNAIPEQIA